METGEMAVKELSFSSSTQFPFLIKWQLYRVFRVFQFALWWMSLKVPWGIRAGFFLSEEKLREVEWLDQNLTDRAEVNLLSPNQHPDSRALLFLTSELTLLWTVPVGDFVKTKAVSLHWLKTVPDRHSKDSHVSMATSVSSKSSSSSSAGGWGDRPLRHKQVSVTGEQRDKEQVASKLLSRFQVLPTEVSKRTVEFYILAMRAMTINYQGGVRDWRVCALLKRAMRLTYRTFWKNTTLSHPQILIHPSTCWALPSHWTLLLMGGYSSPKGTGPGRAICKNLDKPVHIPGFLKLHIWKDLKWPIFCLLLF